MRSTRRHALRALSSSPAADTPPARFEVMAGGPGVSLFAGAQAKPSTRAASPRRSFQRRLAMYRREQDPRDIHSSALGMAPPTRRGHRSERAALCEDEWMPRIQVILLARCLPIHAHGGRDGDRHMGIWIDEA